jgi:ABC-2 type transport system permease protein
MHTGGLTIYWRGMLRFVRFRALLFTTLIQPVLWLAFFGIAMSNNFDRLTVTLPAIPDVRTVGYLNLHRCRRYCHEHAFYEPLRGNCIALR